MTKPRIYVVKTNYDWPQSYADINKNYIRSAEETSGNNQSRDLFREVKDSNHKGFSELERGIKEECNKEIFPNLELSRGYFRCNFYKGLRSRNTLPSGDGSSFLREFILGNVSRFARSKLPENFTHFEVIIDYLSNYGGWDGLIGQLRSDFDIKQRELLWKRK